MFSLRWFIYLRVNGLVRGENTLFCEIFRGTAGPCGLQWMKYECEVARSNSWFWFMFEAGKDGIDPIEGLKLMQIPTLSCQNMNFEATDHVYIHIGFVPSN